MLTVLLVLLILPASLSVSSAENDVITNVVTQPNSDAAALTKFSYVMMDADGFAASDPSWKVLLFQATKDLADLFKDVSRVRLNYMGDTCEAGSQCDKVKVFKETQVNYRVFIYCSTKSSAIIPIDAKKMPDIAKRIAWAISAHDNNHKGNDKPKP